MAQQPQFMWLKRMGADGYNEAPGRVSTDSSGNAYTTGTFIMSSGNPYYVDLPNSTPQFASGLSSGNYTNDAYVMKHGKDATYQWLTPYHYNLTETGTHIHTAADGISYTTGLQNNSAQHYFAKYSTAGTLTWRRSLDGTNGGSQIPGGIVEDANRNVFGAGAFAGTQVYQLSPAINLVSAGATDAYLVSYTATGANRWAKRFGGSGTEVVKALAYDGGQYIYVAGEFQGAVDFNPDAAVFTLTGATGSFKDFFVSKFDTAGNFITAFQFASGANTMTDLVLDAAGNMYIAGSYAQTVDFDPGPATYNLSSINTTNDAFVLKLSNTGSFIWVRDFDGLGYDEISDIALDNSANLYAGGRFSSAILTFGSNSLNNTSSTNTLYDGFFSMLDSSGTFKWFYKLGAGNNDAITGITLDRQRNLYLTGTYIGAVNFNVLSSGNSQVLSTQSASTSDAFLVKYSTECPNFLAPVGSTGACVGSTLSLNPVLGPGNYTYQWFNNGLSLSNGSKYAGAQDDTLIINNYAAADTGKYVLQINNAVCGAVTSDTFRLNYTGTALSNGLLYDIPVSNNTFVNTVNQQNLGGSLNSGGYTNNRNNIALSAITLTNGFNTFNLPAAYTSDEVSVSFWYKPQGLQAGITYGTLVHSNGGPMHLAIRSDYTLGWYKNTTSTFYPANIVLSTANWYHIVLIKKGTLSRIYVNGTAVYETNNAIAISAANINKLFGDGTSAGALGNYDQVKVYTRELNDLEIQSIYKNIELLSLAADPFACPGSGARMKASFTNTGLNYQWYKNMQALSNGSKYMGVNTDSLYISNAAIADSGNYYLVASNPGIHSCINYQADSVYFETGIPAVGSGLLHSYYFNNSILDQAGTNHLNGTAVYATGGRFNTGANLNLVNMSSPVTMPTPVNRDTISTSLWVYVTISGTNRVLLAPGSGNARHLKINTDDVIGFVNGAGVFVPSKAKLAANTWTHIVISKVGLNQKIYVNGILVLNSDNSFSNNNAVNALSIFGFGPGITDKTSGLLDDVRIYGKELTQADVNGLYRYFNFNKQPVNTVACNTFSNIKLIGGVENTNETQYQYQWKKNGVALSNGAKYSGVTDDSLLVSNASFADTGSYTLEVTSVYIPCMKWESSAANIIINTASLMADSLRLYYKFNGSVADYSGRNVSSTANNVTYTTGLKTASNAAINCNGSSTYISNTNVIPTGTIRLTISTWFKTSAFGGIIGNSSTLPTGTATNFHPVIYVGTDNKLKAKFNNGNTTPMSSSVMVNDNAWHHAAISLNGATQSLYLDGVLVATVSGTTPAIQTNFTIGTSFTTGWQMALTGWYYFQGAIDETRFYNNVLSAEEISRLYHTHGFATVGNLQVNICKNAGAVIQSNAAGTGIAYRWRKNGVLLSNSSNLSGTDSSALVFNSFSVSDSGRYTVEIANNCLTLVSDTIRVNLLNPVVITTQPQNTSTCNGGVAAITVGVQASAPFYQWKKAGVALVNNGSTITGAQSQTLTLSNVSASDTGLYYCVINNSCNTDSSIAVRLSLNNGLQLLQLPVPTVACQNQSSYLFVRASDLGANYTWKKNGTAISGSNNDTLFFTNTLLSDSGNYSVVVNSLCGIDSSANVKLTVNRATAITVQPAGITTVCSGGNAALGLTADGVGLAYQWRKNGIDISGATGNTLNLNNIQVSDSGNYTCFITSACGNIVSNTARVNVNQANQILTQPQALQNKCTGNNAIIWVSAAGNNVTYQWKRNGVNISGSNNDTLFRNNVSIAGDSGVYTVDVSSATCPAVTSNPARLTVNAATNIVTQPANKVACVGKPVLFTIAATGGSLQYQWRKNGTDISNATNADYSISSFALADTGIYSCVVTGSCGTPVVSANASLSLSVPLAISTQPATPVKVCGNANSYVNLNVVATGSVLGYQWFKNNTPLNNQVNVITGATTGNLSVAINSVGAGNYSCKIYGACDTLTSNISEVSYYANAQIVSQPVAASVCAGSTAVFKVKINSDGINSYQWLRNGINLPANPRYSGINSDSLVITNTNSSDMGNYALIFTDVCNIQYNTTQANLSLSNGIAIVAQSPAAVNVCTNNNGVLFVQVNNSAATYQWKKNGVNINNEVNDTLLLNNASAADNGSYTCDISSTCGNITSVASVVSVVPGPVPTITQNGNTMSTQTFTTYQWKKNGVNIAGAQSQSYTATESGTYSVSVSNGSCSATSADFNFTYVSVADVLAKANGITVYPNPFHSVLTIAATGKEGWVVELYSVTGVLYKSVSFNNTTVLDVADLAAGVYVVKATNSFNESITLKVVKQ